MSDIQSFQQGFEQLQPEASRLTPEASDPQSETPLKSEMQPLLSSSGPQPRVISNPFTQDQRAPQIGLTGSFGGAKKGQDIVQFSCPLVTVHEDIEEGKVFLYCIRIGGNLSERCTVHWKTEDGSAKKGKKYVESSGELTFEPHEEMKAIQVQILADNAFDTNLDFLVEMTNPEGCVLADELKICRVMIVDDDVFPSNKFEQQVKEFKLDDVGPRVLVSFVVFCLQRIPDVGRRSAYVLLLDQVDNISYLLNIWLNVYLVDVVFGHKEENLKRLWVPNQKLWTAVLVALAITAPKGLITLIQYVKLGDLSVAGKVKLHLKVNLFRKYLYYSAASHTKVSPQELMSTMGDDINELVSLGFMVIFQLAQQVVKVAVIMYFLCKKRPTSALPLLVYPIAMAIVLNSRYRQTLELKDSVGDAEDKIHTQLRHSCDDIGLIKEYNMRTQVVIDFEQIVKDSSPPNRKFNEYDFRTMLAMPWITHFAIAIFIILGGHYVLTDTLSLGAFLATIGIYRDAGELFSNFYEHLKNCYTVIGPLLQVVTLINLETDAQVAISQLDERQSGMIQQLENPDPKDNVYGKSRFDTLFLKLDDVSLATDRGGPQYPLLQHISVTIPQGQMVAILGPHGSGKFSMLRLLKGAVRPKTNGRIIIPTHLRCICVTSVPQLFRNGNLLQNLKFGKRGAYDKKHLVDLCNLVRLNQHSMNMVDKQLKEEEDHVDAHKKKEERSKKMNRYLGDDAHAAPWYEQLSLSELCKMNIIRALYFDPEILCFQRPVDEMDADHAARVLGMFRSFVDHRGVLKTRQQMEQSRPKNIFFTSNEDRERAEAARDIADVAWFLSDKGFKQELGGVGSHRRHNTGGITGSWSREVQQVKETLQIEQRQHQQLKDTMDRKEDQLKKLQRENEEQTGKLNSVKNEIHAWQTKEQRRGCMGPFDFGGTETKTRLNDLTRMVATPRDKSMDSQRSPV